MVVGVLIFYRWKTEYTWADAPVVVRNAITQCEHKVIQLRITLCMAGNRVKKDTPENYTACTAVEFSDLSAEVQHEFNRAGLLSNPMECRFDSAGTPHSLVAWAPGTPMITVPGRDFVTLADLAEQRALAFTVLLKDMIRLREKSVGTNRTAKRRRMAEVGEVSRALAFAKWTGDTANSLLRVVKPHVEMQRLMEQFNGEIHVPAFAESLCSVTPEQRVSKFRAGFRDPTMPTDTALRLILIESQWEVREMVRCGMVGCARTGYLRTQTMRRNARASRGPEGGPQAAQRKKLRQRRSS